MALKVCMNILCGTMTSPVWKKGWIMRSGQIAVLCDKCGFAYEQNIFCGTFHADDSGWRECKTCGKPLHCGCIASEALVEILDLGGVKCTSCARNSGPYSGKTDENPERHVAVTVDGGIKNYGNYEVGDGPKRGSIPRNNDTNVSLGQPKHEVDLSSHGVGTICSSNTEFSPVGLPKESRLDISSANLAAKGICGLVQPNLGISLGGLTANRQSFVGMAFQEKEQFSLCAPFRPGSVMPEPQTLSLTSHCDTNLSMVPPVRVARPPVEGRGRNQLLPRYWPRITDQELQQMSGDSNCTIVPLFEKVLSASDAGRIGRLVLPKACAEEYFPPISQPEGLPLKIQDVKGKEWVFQFRFWPNNNSRMYVLEGVTPCIQSMQLQAGDTVIFSRMDPVGKLVMGCRKASAPVQGGADPRATALSRQVNSSGGHSAWNNEQCVGKSGECMLISSMLLPDKKKSRNIGSKSKRLLIDSQEMLELKLCWEEVHDMLRPTQGSNPNVVTIEDYEIEEYEEPPVFGKWSIFAVRSSGLLEQWAQCDSCCKWRRFPVDVLLPSKWTCTENIWEPSRSSCSAPDELSPRELENFVRLSKDYKKRKVSLSHKTVQEQESSGLDALANAATLRNDVCDPGASSVAATTKHPRHRAGCSCIVCIQPPSGKGKHKPSCTCNVCMTVKRRFKTLMLRKKKRQSEQEAEIALRNNLKQGHKDDAEGDSLLGHTRPRLGPPDNEVTMTDDLPANCHIQYLTSKEMDSSKSLDLNCQPDRQTELARLSMAGLLQLANQPLETYMKQSGLQTLTSDQQASSGSRAVHHSAGETGGQLVEDRLTIDSELQKQENAGDENGSPDKSQHVTQ